MSTTTSTSTVASATGATSSSSPSAISSPGAFARGCACGGFYGILREFEPTIDYCGVDISAPLLAEARRLYPAGRFELVDGVAMSYPAGRFDLVQSWGVLLHEPEYRALIREAWRVCAEVLLFDARLQAHGREVVDLDRSFILNPGGVKNYYIVPNAAEFVGDLLALDPRPAAIEMFGYAGQPNRFATLPEGTEPVYMVAVGIRRGNTAGAPVRLDLRLPRALLGEIRRALHGDARAILGERQAMV